MKNKKSIQKCRLENGPLSIQTLICLLCYILLADFKYCFGKNVIEKQSYIDDGSILVNNFRRLMGTL